MKLVKFMCTVATLKAEEAGKDKVEAHAVWINPEDVQMVAPVRVDKPDHVFLFFKGGRSDSTSVEGTFEEVVEKLTTA